MPAIRSLTLCTIAAVALAACSSEAPMRGNWTVDIDATVRRAIAGGIPESAAAEIREIYGGGRLEIGTDTLILRIAGFSEAEAHNYQVVGQAGNCYKLEIIRSKGIHSYCVDGKQLVVEDPNAKLAVVFKRE